MAISFGVFVPQGWRMDLVSIDDPVEKYEAMTRAAQAAEASGFDSIWVYDHFHPVPKPVQETVFECWTITAGLARDTSRIHIGQMVTCNGYRNPALLAKMASTVDVMSHGRLYFGLGAGWYEHEWRAYGYSFPETPVRLGMLREACAIIDAMWTQDSPELHGKYYTIDQPINQPKGVRKPHPQFWIGGSGEKVTLRLVARYGDACNIGGSSEVLRHKFEVLRQHCEEVGRNYDDIIRSTNVNIHLIEPGESPEQATAQIRHNLGDASVEEYARSFWVVTPEQAVDQLQALVETGAQYLIVYMPMLAWDTEPLRRFAQEVIPHVQ